MIVKEVPVRRFPALLGAAALVAATLAGFSAAGASSGCTPTYSSGDASSLVTASGKSGAAPTVEFPTPLVTKKSQVSTLEAGDGTPIASGSQVDYDVSMFLGKTGEPLSATGYDGKSFQRSASGTTGNSLSIALECAKVGERLAIATTAAEVKAAFQEGAFQSGGINDTDTIVLVVDVVAAYLGKANGFNQLPKDGMPTVVTAVDGEPAIAVGLVSPPAKTEASTIKAGSGAAVKKDDAVVLNFSAWIWPADGSEPTSFSSSWTGGQAVTFGLTNFDDGGGLPTGIVDNLIGEKVGGQVLIVLAPGDDSFPADNLPQGITADSTVIFVFDLLGIQK